MTRQGPRAACMYCAN